MQSAGYLSGDKSGHVNRSPSANSTLPGLVKIFSASKKLQLGAIAGLLMIVLAIALDRADFTEHYSRLSILLGVSGFLLVIYSLVRAFCNSAGLGSVRRCIEAPIELFREGVFWFFFLVFRSLLHVWRLVFGAKSYRVQTDGNDSGQNARSNQLDQHQGPNKRVEGSGGNNH